MPRGRSTRHARLEQGDISRHRVGIDMRFIQKDVPHTAKTQRISQTGIVYGAIGDVARQHRQKCCKIALGLGQRVQALQLGQVVWDIVERREDFPEFALRGKTVEVDVRQDRCDPFKDCGEPGIALHLEDCSSRSPGQSRPTIASMAVLSSAG